MFPSRALRLPAPLLLRNPHSKHQGELLMPRDNVRSLFAFHFAPRVIYWRTFAITIGRDVATVAPLVSSPLLDCEARHEFSKPASAVRFGCEPSCRLLHDM